MLIVEMVQGDPEQVEFATFDLQAKTCENCLRLPKNSVGPRRARSWMRTVQKETLTTWNISTYLQGRTLGVLQACNRH